MFYGFSWDTLGLIVFVASIVFFVVSSYSSANDNLHVSGWIVLFSGIVFFSIHWLVVIGFCFDFILG